MSDDDALHVALRLKALADPARVKIMSYLFSSSSGEENSGDLAALGLTESTLSHHLTQLRRAGLVESERLGMNVYPRPHRDALGALCVVLDPNCCTPKFEGWRVPLAASRPVSNGQRRLSLRLQPDRHPAQKTSSRATPTHSRWFRAEHQTWMESHPSGPGGTRRTRYPEQRSSDEYAAICTELVATYQSGSNE